MKCMPPKRNSKLPLAVLTVRYPGQKPITIHCIPEKFNINRSGCPFEVDTFELQGRICLNPKSDKVKKLRRVC